MDKVGNFFGSLLVNVFAPGFDVETKHDCSTIAGNVGDVMDRLEKRSQKSINPGGKMTFGRFEGDVDPLTMVSEVVCDRAWRLGNSAQGVFRGFTQFVGKYTSKIPHVSKGTAVATVFINGFGSLISKNYVIFQYLNYAHIENLDVGSISGVIETFREDIEDAHGGEVLGLIDALIDKALLEMDKAIEKKCPTVDPQKHSKKTGTENFIEGLAKGSMESGKNVAKSLLTLSAYQFAHQFFEAAIEDSSKRNKCYQHSKKMMIGENGLVDKLVLGTIEEHKNFKQELLQLFVDFEEYEKKEEFIKIQEKYRQLVGAYVLLHGGWDSKDVKENIFKPLITEPTMLGIRESVANECAPIIPFVKNQKSYDMALKINDPEQKEGQLKQLFIGMSDELFGNSFSNEQVYDRALGGVLKDVAGIFDQLLQFEKENVHPVGTSSITASSEETKKKHQEHIGEICKGLFSRILPVKAPKPVMTLLKTGIDGAFKSFIPQAKVISEEYWKNRKFGSLVEANLLLEEWGVRKEVEEFSPNVIDGIVNKLFESAAVDLVDEFVPTWERFLGKKLHQMKGPQTKDKELPYKLGVTAQALKRVLKGETACEEMGKVKKVIGEILTSGVLACGCSEEPMGGGLKPKEIFKAVGPMMGVLNGIVKNGEEAPNRFEEITGKKGLKAKIDNIIKTSGDKYLKPIMVKGVDDILKKQLGDGPKDYITEKNKEVLVEKTVDSVMEAGHGLVDNILFSLMNKVLETAPQLGGKMPNSDQIGDKSFHKKAGAAVMHRVNELLEIHAKDPNHTDLTPMPRKDFVKKAIESFLKLAYPQGAMSLPMKNEDDRNKAWKHLMTQMEVHINGLLDKKVVGENTAYGLTQKANIENVIKKALGCAGTEPLNNQINQKMNTTLNDGLKKVSNAISVIWKSIQDTKDSLFKWPVGSHVNWFLDKACHIVFFTIIGNIFKYTVGLFSDMLVRRTIDSIANNVTAVGKSDLTEKLMQELILTSIKQLGKDYDNQNLTPEEADSLFQKERHKLEANVGNLVLKGTFMVNTIVWATMRIVDWGLRFVLGANFIRNKALEVVCFFFPEKPKKDVPQEAKGFATPILPYVKLLLGEKMSGADEDYPKPMRVWKMVQEVKGDSPLEWFVDLVDRGVKVIPPMFAKAD